MVFSAQTYLSGGWKRTFSPISHLYVLLQIPQLTPLSILFRDTKSFELRNPDATAGYSFYSACHSGISVLIFEKISDCSESSGVYSYSAICRACRHAQGSGRRTERVRSRLCAEVWLSRLYDRPAMKECIGDFYKIEETSEKYIFLQIFPMNMQVLKTVLP